MRQNACPVQPTENIGTYRSQNDVFVWYEVQFLLSEMMPVSQNLNYNLQKILSHVLPYQH